jgi:hypothetical protein
VDRGGPAAPRAGDLHEWIDLAQRERVLPLLHIVAQEPGVVLDERQHDLVHAMALDAAGVAVRLEHELLNVLPRLHDAGVEPLVTKGLAAAHLDHPDPARRQFGDVDLLVHPAVFEHTMACFRAQGWTEPYRLSPAQRGFAHAVTVIGPGRLEHDVHRRVARKALGVLVPTEAVVEERVALEIAGAACWAPSARDRLILAALHLVRSRGGYRRLSTMTDILVMTDQGRLDPDDVLARAGTWRVAALVAKAIDDTYQTARLDTPRDWRRACTHGSGRRDRLVEVAYLGARRRPVVEELAYLRLLRPRRDRWRYLDAYLTPRVRPMSRRSSD